MVTISAPDGPFYKGLWSQFASHESVSSSTSVDAPGQSGGASFHDVVEPFLRQPGLPFADVLEPELIERTFARHGGLFATDDIYSTPVVLWAFLAQVLRDGKGSACSAAVADIATYLEQTGRRSPSGDTGDYCRARAKLSAPALRELTRRVATALAEGAPDDWRWHGRCPKLVDGFDFTMADTPANQLAFPQQKSQAPGLGWPIARVCAVLDLATAAIHDLAVGPYQGKETGETALLRRLLDTFRPGDLVVFDRCYCSYMMLALLRRRGVDVCARLHGTRKIDFDRAVELGPGDYLVTWTRPKRPSWMSPAQYRTIPETLTLRLIEFDVTEGGQRVESLSVVTTVTDPVECPAEDLARLYGYRWFVELDIRHIKQTLDLDHVPCKSPGMVERHLRVTALAYNLIRRTIATAAAVHHRRPRSISFTTACQIVLSAWMLRATGACRDEAAMTRSALKRIADAVVGNRPGRIEPRALKRRRHRYPLMTKPRHQLRQEQLTGPPRDNHAHDIENTLAPEGRL